MFLGGGENKDDMLWRFLESLEERVECSRGQHMHLVDDKHLVLAHLRRDACLLHERLYLFHGVVAGCVQLENVVRTLLVESAAAFALATCFTVRSGVEAVDGLGENSRTRSLSHSSRSAEQVGMRQFAALYGVLERRRKRSLSHYGVESHRTVLACRYDIVFHIMIC